MIHLISSFIHKIATEKPWNINMLRTLLTDCYLQVKDMVRPGCSYEILNTALSYMSSLATILSAMPQKLHASL